MLCEPPAFCHSKHGKVAAESLGLEPIKEDENAVAEGHLEGALAKGRQWRGERVMMVMVVRVLLKPE
jgi:hypothetical protein